MDWKVGLAIPGAVAVLVGSVVTANDYFAKSKDLQLVEYRLDQKIRYDRMDRIQERLWNYEDKYRGIPECDWAPQDLDEYRRLELELRKLEKENRK